MNENNNNSDLVNVFLNQPPNNGQPRDDDLKFYVSMQSVVGLVMENEYLSSKLNELSCELEKKNIELDALKQNISMMSSNMMYNNIMLANLSQLLCETSLVNKLILSRYAKLNETMQLEYEQQNQQQTMLLEDRTLKILNKNIGGNNMSMSTISTKKSEDEVIVVESNNSDNNTIIEAEIEYVDVENSNNEINTETTNVQKNNVDDDGVAFSYEFIARYEMDTITLKSREYDRVIENEFNEEKISLEDTNYIFRTPNELYIKKHEYTINMGDYTLFECYDIKYNIEWKKLFSLLKLTDAIFVGIRLIDAPNGDMYISLYHQGSDYDDLFKEEQNTVNILKYTIDEFCGDSDVLRNVFDIFAYMFVLNSYKSFALIEPILDYEESNKGAIISKLYPKTDVRLEISIFKNRSDVYTNFKYRYFIINIENNKYLTIKKI